jgi:hypothetical protein
MAFLKQLRAKDFQNVSNGAVATSEVPLGGTIHRLRMRVLDSSGDEISVANLKTYITDIKLTLSGVTIWEATAKVLLALEQFYKQNGGHTNQAGMIPIEFSNPVLATHLFRSTYALGTAGQTALQVSAKIASANVSSIELYYDVTPDVQTPGLHKRLLRFDQSFASTGVHTITDLPRDIDTGYMALHITGYAATAVVTQVELILDGRTIFQELPEEVLEAGYSEVGRNKQTDFFHIDFQRTNDLAGFLSMRNADGKLVQDLRLRLTWGTAAPTAYQIYGEMAYGIPR